MHRCILVNTVHQEEVVVQYFLGLQYFLGSPQRRIYRYTQSHNNVAQVYVYVTIGKIVLP